MISCERLMPARGIVRHAEKAPKMAAYRHAKAPLYTSSAYSPTLTTSRRVRQSTTTHGHNHSTMLITNQTKQCTWNT